MIETILFATDLGIYTPFLLHHVNAIASRHEARVIVLHAIEPPGHMSDAVVEVYLNNDVRQELQQNGLEQIIEELKGRIVDLLEEEFIDGREGLSNIRDVKVIAGRPASVILDQAEPCGADMIILGSHGTGTEGPNMLGSVTSRVLQMSRVPVYMVPLVRNIMTQAKAS